jgi:hypothetical protein
MQKVVVAVTPSGGRGAWQNCRFGGRRHRLEVGVPTSSYPSYTRIVVLLAVVVALVAAAGATLLATDSNVAGIESNPSSLSAQLWKARPHSFPATAAVRCSRPC